MEEKTKQEAPKKARINRRATLAVCLAVFAILVLLRSCTI